VSLERFKTAQAKPHAGHATALAELRAGRKQSHWIWYILPQLGGLGQSSTARLYGLDLDEAVSYLRDPELRDRLVEIVAVIAVQLADPEPVSLSTLFPGIDATKAVSSLTLFEGVASWLGEVESDGTYDAVEAQLRGVLDAVGRQGFARCAFTLKQLNQLWKREG